MLPLFRNSRKLQERARSSAFRSTSCRPLAAWASLCSTTNRSEAALCATGQRKASIISGNTGVGRICRVSTACRRTLLRTAWRHRADVSGLQSCQCGIPRECTKDVGRDRRAGLRARRDSAGHGLARGLGEPPTALHVVGGLLILGGVWWLSLNK